MKKFLALLLAAMMLFSLAACGGNETPSGNDDKTPSSGQQQEQNTPDPDDGGEMAGWPTEGYGAVIPEPDWEYEIIQDDEYRFVATFENKNTDELQNYLQVLSDAGVSTIGERGEGTTWYFHGKINDMLVQLEDGRVLVEPYK